MDRRIEVGARVLAQFEHVPGPRGAEVVEMAQRPAGEMRRVGERLGQDEDRGRLAESGWVRSTTSADPLARSDARSVTLELGMRWVSCRWMSQRSECGASYTWHRGTMQSYAGLGDAYAASPSERPGLHRAARSTSLRTVRARSTRRRSRRRPRCAAPPRRPRRGEALDRWPGNLETGAASMSDCERRAPAQPGAAVGPPQVTEFRDEGLVA